MKLRLENGNFSIKGLLHIQDTTPTGAELITTTLPKGLSYMDFIGAVIDYGNAAEVITNAVDFSHPVYGDYVQLFQAKASEPIFYNKATGELSFSNPANPGDDGGSDGGTVTI